MLWRTQAQKRQPPGSIEPCIPTAALKPPIGPQWIHEIKHDGYRLIVRKKDDRVRLFTRRGPGRPGPTRALASGPQFPLKELSCRLGRDADPADIDAAARDGAARATGR